MVKLRIMVTLRNPISIFVWFSLMWNPISVFVLNTVFTDVDAKGVESWMSISTGKPGLQKIIRNLAQQDAVQHQISSWSKKINPITKRINPRNQVEGEQSDVAALDKRKASDSTVSPLDNTSKRSSPLSATDNSGVQKPEDNGPPSCMDSPLSLARAHTIEERSLITSILGHDNTVAMGKKTPSGKCGPANDNMICAAGCCSIFGWCGGGPDWCTCRVCNEGFGRCADSYERKKGMWGLHPLGQRQCHKPPEANRLAEIFFGGLEPDSKVQNTNVEATYDRIMQKVGLSASHEQVLRSFQCLTGELNLTLDQIEDIVTKADMRNLSLRDVVTATIMLRSYQDVSTNPGGIWPGLSTMMKSSSMKSVVSFLLFLQTNLCDSMKQAQCDVPLATVTKSLGDLMSAYPGIQLSQIDRIYSQMKLVFGKFDFLQFSTAISSIQTRNKVFDFEQATQMVITMKRDTFLQGDIGSIVKDIAATRKVWYEDNAKMRVDDKTATMETISGVKQLSEMFHLAETEEVGMASPQLEKIYATASNAPSFPEVAQFLINVRDAFHPPLLQPNIMQAAEVVENTHHQLVLQNTLHSSEQSKQIEQKILNHLTENGTPDLTKLRARPGSSHFPRSGIANSATGIANFMGVAESDVTDACTRLQNAYSNSNAGTFSDELCYLSLKTLYERFENQFTLTNGVDRLIELASVTEDAQGLVETILGGKTTYYRLDVVAKSLCVLSRYNDILPVGGSETTTTIGPQLPTDISSKNTNASGKEKSGKDTLTNIVDSSFLGVPFKDCTKTLGLMMKELRTSSDLLDGALSFASLKLNLGDVESLDQAWMVLSDIHAVLPKNGSWQEASKSLHGLLHRFTHLQFVHHLHDLLLDLKLSYNIQSFGDLNYPLDQFEQHFPQYRDDIHVMLLFLIKLQPGVDPDSSQAADMGAIEALVDTTEDSDKIGTTDLNKRAIERNVKEGITLQQATDGIIILKPFSGAYHMAEKFFDAILLALAVLEPAFTKDDKAGGDAKPGADAPNSSVLHPLYGNSFVHFLDIAEEFRAFYNKFAEKRQYITLEDLVLTLEKLHEEFPHSTFRASLQAIGRLPRMFPGLSIHQLLQEGMDLRGNGNIADVVNTLEKYHAGNPGLTWEEAKEKFVQEVPDTVTNEGHVSWSTVAFWVIVLAVIGTFVYHSDSRKKNSGTLDLPGMTSQRLAVRSYGTTSGPPEPIARAFASMGETWKTAIGVHGLRGNDTSKARRASETYEERAEFAMEPVTTIGAGNAQREGESGKAYANTISTESQECPRSPPHSSGERGWPGREFNCEL